MTVAALFASHTPLMDYVDPGPEIRAGVDAGFARLKRFVADFAPELVIEFGPDHFNGFFYQLMPAFCVGAAAHSVGDWQMPKGPLPVPADIAEALVRHVHSRDVDVAISYRMAVDHGITQLLYHVFDWSALPPIVPIFLNGAAAPRARLSRVVALGRAVGEFAGSLGKRVLIMGSGGLSHDPPFPTLASAPPEVRERMITGIDPDPEGRAARQRRVLDEGRKMLDGTSELLALNPEWDRTVLAKLAAADFDGLTALDDDAITREGGRGGHEIRTWIAGCAAMSALGPYRADVHFYRDIAAWVAGFGMMTVQRSG
jgi:2,3-dihydroxyphenylpropionate 1,2-dioxygenase